MKNKVAILIPTYGRAYKLEALLKNILESTLIDIGVYFIVESSDKESMEKLMSMEYANMIINKRKESYAGAINTAYEQVLAEYYFAGGDDLNFHFGWLEKCLALTDKYSVIGTNDLLNREVMRGTHATHYLVRRDYLEVTGGTIDHTFPFLYEYEHNYTDREFIETAQARGAFIPCLESIVEHIHFGNKKAVYDATYQKNQATLSKDRGLYFSRQALWK